MSLETKRLRLEEKGEGGGGDNNSSASAAPPSNHDRPEPQDDTAETHHRDQGIDDPQHTRDKSPPNHHRRPSDDQFRSLERPPIGHNAQKPCLNRDHDGRKRDRDGEGSRSDEERKRDRDGAGSRSDENRKRDGDGAGSRSDEDRKRDGDGAQDEERSRSDTKREEGEDGVDSRLERSKLRSAERKSDVRDEEEKSRNMDEKVTKGELTAKGEDGEDADDDGSEERRGAVSERHQNPRGEKWAADSHRGDNSYRPKYYYPRRGGGGGEGGDDERYRKRKFDRYDEQYNNRRERFNGREDRQGFRRDGDYHLNQRDGEGGRRRGGEDYRRRDERGSRGHEEWHGRDEGSSSSYRRYSGPNERSGYYEERRNYYRGGDYDHRDGRRYLPCNENGRYSGYNGSKYQRDGKEGEVNRDDRRSQTETKRRMEGEEPERYAGAPNRRVERPEEENDRKRDSHRDTRSRGGGGGGEDDDEFSRPSARAKPRIQRTNYTTDGAKEGLRNAGQYSRDDQTSEKRSFNRQDENPKRPSQAEQPPTTSGTRLIEITVNDRLGKKARIKCSPMDTVGNVKKLAAAQLGTRPEKMKFQKQHVILKDHIDLDAYEIKDGMNIELYYN